ncbi:MAG TPA: glycosyltransferase family 2 protein [Saprospiraceae bacterium]|nr:glycosyltransferase family 2 protein [Saprospiraceae bacterium]
MDNSLPSESSAPIRFSIITVVYNGESLLKGTMESVLRQTYSELEYIVVDGASKDQSLAIIQEYAAKMPGLRWISEPDKGLYDAMNKGLAMATGDFVQFLNAGDWLHAPDTLEKLAAICTSQTDVLYGDTMLVDESRTAHGLMSELSTRTLPDPLHWRHYLAGMRVVHQSFIPRRNLAPAYRLEAGLCADFDWCIEILKKSRDNRCLKEPITDYLMGGLSKKRHRQSLNERFAIMQRHFGLPLTLVAHAWIVLRAGIHRLKRWGRERY